MSGSDWGVRTELQIGKENFQKLNNSHVLVLGLGGVGAYAAEILCRAGIGKLTIVDGDIIQPTNLNRQLPALRSTIGLKKAYVMADRLRDINPGISLQVIDEYIPDEKMADLLDGAFDYTLDAIDTLSPKIQLIYHSINKSIPIVSSMGAGGKYDPTRVQIADISESHTCKFARIVRKRLHRYDIFKGFKVVFSSEIVDPLSIELTDDEINKRSIVGTISYMPAIFGCCCASTVIRDIIDFHPQNN
jgi:tRNA threonylcarbamoyladenosine dehydratase